MFEKTVGRISLSMLMLAVAAVAPRAARATPEADAARADIQKTIGFVPVMFRLLPDLALPGAWQETKGLHLNPSTALPGKYKDLVGIAVAAQIPCEYCIYAHTELAKLNGATDAEISEAVAMGALTRKWSTWLNGIQTDEGKFRSEIAQLVTNTKKMMASGGPPPSKPMPVTESAGALKQVEQSFGFAPEFLRRYPQEGLAGAWTEMRDLEMNPGTAIPGKYKSMIGLAVAAQIPCKFCIIADTEFAKLDGATDREIGEAIAMSGLVRHWSTILNGRQADKVAFKKEINRLVAGARKHMASGPVGKPAATITAAK
jgi:AhpD family alkylhydroperoxidase